MPDTIVMIHGMFGGGWYWHDYGRFFEAKGYRCVSPTLRYHDIDPEARPDPRLGNTSLLDYANDLEKEIGGIREPPILLGHSMGGLLAQMLATRVRPRALVLLAPAPPVDILALKPTTMRCFLSGLMRWGCWRKPFRLTFGEAVYGPLRLLNVEERQRIYSRFVYESGRAAFEAGFGFLDKRRAATVDRSRVTCPVLVVAGTQDRMLPSSISRKVAARYEAAYQEFSSHGHWLVGEPGWEDVAEYIASWLSGTVASPDTGDSERR